MIIYLTEANEIDPKAIGLLKEHHFEVITEKADADAKAGGVEALFVRTYTNVDKALLDAYPSAKYVLRAGVGLDNVDVAECKARGITVINSPGANSNAVAEYVVATALYALRNMRRQEASLRSGGWRVKELMGGEIKGKTLGLVGCGNVGRMIAKKLASFELKEIIGYDPYLSEEQLKAAGIRKAELAEAIASADVLSLHVPLLKETHHLMNEAQFASMKKGAYLINAARGGVVDEKALAAAVKSGHLAGAVLDVFETEPKVEEELLLLPNVLLTPHLGGYTLEANQEVSLAPVRELIRLVGQGGVV